MCNKGSILHVRPCIAFSVFFSVIKDRSDFSVWVFIPICYGLDLAEEL